VRVVSTAAILWVVRILTLTSSAVLSILTARALGPHGRGAYALPAIDASLATTFAAGLSSAAAYFMLAKQAGRSLLRALAVVLVAFIGLGFCATLATAAASRSLWAFVPSACFVVAYSAYSLACGFYLGLDRARSAAFLNAGAYFLTLCLVAAALAVDRSSPQLAILGWVLGMAIAGIVGVALALRESRHLAGGAVGFRPVLHFAARAGLVNLVNLLNYRLDIFIVAIFASTSIVGLYTLAVTGAESVLSMTLALSVAALPRIGTLNAREAGIFTARCLRNGIFLAFVLAVLAFVSAPVVIRMVLGATYAPIVLPRAP
jgi:O-antigen/teichoic acid export membrane protein